MTNDDGVDSVGLHRLAERLSDDHDVVVAAPDREYSGAGAAIGTIHLIEPEVHRIGLPGVLESWAVTGPPALCVMFARLGVFGGPFDLVVSGINPGANTGRAIYHSGTVGAVLTARGGRMSGIAVSQAVEGFGVEGQGWDEMLVAQRWDTASEIAAATVDAFTAAPPDSAMIVNLNVPNLPLDEIKGWRRTEVASLRRGPWPTPSSSRRSATRTPSTCGWAGAIPSSCLSTPTPAPSSAATCRSPTSAASPTTRRPTSPPWPTTSATCPSTPPEPS